MKNKLSLAVGTYKNPDLIIRTLKGLLMQSFKDFKIYVFDDNDPNDIEMVNETYDKIMMLKDERITYVKNDFNIGVPFVYKKWINSLNSKYFMIIGEGDVLFPNSIEKMIIFWN